MFYSGTTREVMNGDRVRMLRPVSNNTRIVGAIGIVRDVSYDRAAVEFDFEMGGHTCNDYCLAGRGWFCPRDSFEYAGKSPDIVESVPATKRCAVCGQEVTPAMNLGARLLKDRCMCDKCVSAYIGRVNGYHFGKDLSYAYAKDKITLGVEIEIDDCDDEGDRDAVISDVINCARDNNYPLIMSHESDGSLSGYGFESVSAPLTINEWKLPAVESQIRTLLESARENGFGFYSDDHAGLHVHIGRKDLCGDNREVSDAVGLLMGWAVAQLWSDGFDDLSRREDLEYTHNFDEDGHGKLGLYDTYAYSDRYYAVNIQNRNTIELRIFKGARTYEDVLLAVDVCYMLAKWATKKINAFNKRNTYTARAHKYDDAKAYADRITWSALVKFSKFPEITLPALRRAGVNI